KLYKEDPEKANEYANMVAKGIQEVNLISPSSDLGVLTQDVLKEGVTNWKPNWDQRWGGNKGNQKFMTPVNLDFLLDYSVLAEDPDAEAFVELTLDKMAMGGVYDQLAGGFYRYSTDSKWKIPHFEKMLYDNAQLLSLYSKGYKVFKDPLFKNTVQETIAFLDREMKSPEGGYYAAIDADSEGEEGKFYIWTEEELKAVLGDEFPLFAAYYDIKPSNIWEKNAYVLSRTLHDDEFLQEHPLSQKQLEQHREEWKEKLLEARNKRPRPRIDDKIIISWNALLINGLVDAYNTFGEASYLEKAEEVFRFLREKGLKGDHLIHSYKEGSKVDHGFLEDYAFLANASLKLYSTTMSEEYLKIAQKLTQIAQDKFNDEASGMYSYKDDEELISKIIKTDDGVLPSPNSVMAENLMLLGHIEYNKEATNKAKSMLSSMVPAIETNPYSYSKWNSLLLKSVYPFFEIAVVGDQASELVANLQRENLPNTLIVGSDKESEAPLFKDRYDSDGTYIYVCQDHTCKLPVTTKEEALEQMRNF
ncbi:MAG: thioredoxin domain-containing protein, partial [Arenibacter latericius]|nr:thioredoxin domain-containing protein [Arenibacter latericius]